MKKFLIFVSIVQLLLSTGVAFAGSVPVPTPLGTVSDFVDHIHQKSQQSVKCPRCDGSGKIIKTKITWSKLKKKFVKARQSAPCTKCDGKGVLQESL